MSVESPPTAAKDGRSRTSPPRIAAAEAATLAIVLCLAFALRAIVVRQSAAQDDAYITYRYAANLAHSLGFVYNAGERVLGTTTPLFTLVLGLAACFGLSPEVTAPWLGVVFDVLIALVGWLALRNRVDRALAWLWLVLYSTFYIPLQACTYGMECQLFLFLVLVAMASFESRRFARTGLLVGLAFLVRVEAVLLAPLFLLEIWISERQGQPRALWVLVASALAVTLPWFVFALSYFGTVIPNSLTAKQFSAGATFADWIVAFIGRNPMLVGLWLLFVVGALALLRRSRTASPRLWLGWTGLYLLFMLIGRPPFFAAWYMPMVVPGLLLGAAAGALALAGIVPLPPRPRSAAIALVWLALSAFVWPRNLASVRAFRNVILSVYVPMGGWIRDHSAVTETVFAGDIGYVGWVSGRRILDGAGLVSPETLRFYRDHAADPLAHVALVLAERPRFVVASTRSPNFPRWATPEFTRLYEPVERFRRTDSDVGQLGPNPDYTVFSLRESERR